MLLQSHCCSHLMQQYMQPCPRGNERRLSVTQHFLLLGLDTYGHAHIYTHTFEYTASIHHARQPEPSDSVLIGLVKILVKISSL